MRHPVPTSATPGGVPRGEAVLADPQQRPAGLVEQLEMPVAGGGDPCPATDEPLLWTDLEDDFREADQIDTNTSIAIQVPEVVSVCVGGMTPGRSVSVTLTAPSGKVVHKADAVPQNGESPKVALRFLPGNEVGRYTITARQDGRTVTREVNAKTATKPRILLISQDPDNTGIQRAHIDRLKFAFGGLSSGKPTMFYLYHDPTGMSTMRFHSAYRVTGGADGGAFLDLLVTAKTPLGRYWMVSDPSKQDLPGAFWMLN
ncbi:hypothetical protein GCM10022214_39910 [Actinomadura miaoliensis]|uniref:Ig-like domain repeat protein n=1 Tax=Actinomadura miaoliensis TaxID=430685 RepID=A0ABP7VZN5_9ACTN